MISPRQSFEMIVEHLERGMRLSTAKDDAYFAMVAAHTHAVLQAASLRRQEARFELAAHVASGRPLQ